MGYNGKNQALEKIGEQEVIIMTKKIVGLENVSGVELAVELQKGGKFVIYRYCISILILTFYNTSNTYFVRADESRVMPGLIFSLLSLFLGWWGIPWGPIRTVQSLIINFQGGKDVTAEVVTAIQATSRAKQEI